MTRHRRQNYRVNYGFICMFRFILYQNVHSLLTLITGLRMKAQNAIRHACTKVDIHRVTIVILLRNHFLYCDSWNRSINQPKGQAHNKDFLNCARESLKGNLSGTTCFVDLLL